MSASTPRTELLENKWSLGSGHAMLGLNKCSQD